jgi:uncharacterized protein YhbP (UPF0306 family)
MIPNVEQTIREYLPQTVHMSLASARDNSPWVCEVHFAYDEGLNLYFRSISSRRHSQEIAGNPRVAGNIVVQHALGDPVRGVYFEGLAELLTSDEEREKAFESFQRCLGKTPDILEEAKREDGHQFYKIEVETFYLFDSIESKPSQKYELKWRSKK